jgi:hypothetical protein
VKSATLRERAAVPQNFQQQAFAAADMHDDEQCRKEPKELALPELAGARGRAPVRQVNSLSLQRRPARGRRRLGGYGRHVGL